MYAVDACHNGQTLNLPHHAYSTEADAENYANHPIATRQATATVVYAIPDQEEA